MSFFKDFKADFTQAMNELMPDSNEMYDTDDLLEEKAEERGENRKDKNQCNDRKQHSPYGTDGKIKPEDLMRSVCQERNQSQYSGDDCQHDRGYLDAERLHI